jgi:O-antigen ligase
MAISSLNKFTFTVLPLVALVIAPGLHDANGIPKLIALVVGGFIYVSMNSNKLFFSSKIQLIPWLMVLSYGVIQLIRLDDLQHFLFGAFFRNGGYITLVTLALIFTVTVNLPREFIDSFYKIFLGTSYGLLVFGVLEILDFLPFKLTNTYQNALTLTLTNSNFASAFLGTFISVFIVYTFLKPKKPQLTKILITILALFLLYKTQSLQGYLVILVNLFLLIVLYRNKIKKLVLGSKKLSYIFLVLFIIVLVIQFNSLVSWIINNGSVKQRLSYWRLSIDIWQDNKLTGVGLENLREYSTKYRDLNLVKQEGIFTAPDRSHNVVLDHFVNGGLFTGISWLLFISLISYLAFSNLINFKKNDYSIDYLMVVIIWFSYVVQSLISVDHLVLTLVGYISGGFIVGQNRNKSGKLFAKLANPKLFRKFNLVIITILFVLFSSYSIQVVKYEHNAYKYLYKNDTTVLQEIYDSKAVVSQTLEDVTVKISQTKDFTNANLFALKLLTYRPSSHQAYYIKSVYLESKGNIPAAKDEMLKALTIDKFNSVYLLGMSIYEYKLGNQLKSEEYLAKTIDINPNQQGVDIVSKIISSN